MTKDIYGSIAALKREQREGHDYRVRMRVGPSKSTMIVAPHGGGIEKRTSKIARAIAGADFSFYLFEGIKRSGNKILHITSHRFNEPRCVSLVAQSQRVVAIHGCVGRDHIVYLGGLDNVAKRALAHALRARGFRVRTAFHKFLGTSSRNICNRGATGRGVQVELSRGLRINGDIDVLASTIRNVLLQLEA